jgi:hypothetical protein
MDGLRIITGHLAEDTSEALLALDFTIGWSIAAVESGSEHRARGFPGRHD